MKKKNLNIPNTEQCLEILKDYSTPNHVIRHCLMVRNVACSIGNKLNEKGYDINIPLLNASCILHDISRVYEAHEKVGATYLRTLGLNEVADIILQHTHYKFFNEIKSISEIDLLCIADRTVKEDKFVGVDCRMEYIKNKAEKSGKYDIVRNIDTATKYLKEYIADIEKILNISLDTLVKSYKNQ